MSRLEAAVSELANIRERMEFTPASKPAIHIAMRMRPGFDAALASPSQVLIQLSPTFSAASFRKMSVSRASTWQKKS